ncbi:hypothetical protein SAMN02745116_01619 [Pilibacter termitis]|uniref:ABC-2 family transporter protein n=1 Tax=Pilibacter termitis TaxID=263852 RepID=A0A1T4P2D1_9ENTE|nr:hypothetical protein [Pilibacter termitis]SJZ85675.1 hypothetical protein SAMN02745116_01619 [Pilibacter termitis]
MNYTFLLELKKNIRDKNIFVVPLLLLIIFTFFCVQNSHEEEFFDGWENERSSMTLTRAFNANGEEQTLEKLNENPKQNASLIKTLEIKEKILQAIDQRDKQKFVKGKLAEVNNRLEDPRALDPIGRLLDKLSQIEYQKILKNKNEYLFSTQRKKPTFNLFQEIVSTSLQSHLLLLFLSLFSAYVFFQAEKSKSKEFVDIFPTQNWKKTLAKLSYFFLYFSLSFLGAIALFFLANSLFFGLGEANYPFAVAVSKGSVTFISASQFLWKFCFLFVLFLLFIVVFNYCLAKWTKNIFVLFIANAFLFLLETAPVLQEEKMLGFKQLFIGSYSNIAKILKNTPYLQGGNGFYPSFSQATLVISAYICIFAILSFIPNHLRKGGVLC